MYYANQAFTNIYIENLTLTYLSEAAYRIDMVLSMGRLKIYLPMDAEDKCFCPLNPLYMSIMKMFIEPKNHAIKIENSNITIIVINWISDIIYLLQVTVIIASLCSGCYT